MRIGAQLLGFERQLVNKLHAANAAAIGNNLRLTTGRRINSASDDPAAFMSLMQHERQLSVVNSSIRNVNRASEIVSQVQTNFSEIRTHINTIRNAALEDVGGGLTAAQRDVKQLEIDTALRAIDSIAGRRINSRQLFNNLKYDVVGTTYVTDVSSLDAAQVDDLQVNSMVDGTSVVLSGSVTPEVVAELTLQGGAGATAEATATFSVTGHLGSANISITRDEHLSGVRDRVNLETETTGVTASLDGNNLVFQSTAAGASAHIEVQALSVEQIVDVNGVNPAHFSSFQVDSMNAHSGITLDGQVKDKAKQGQLKYDSDNGDVKKNATFTLSGNLGSAIFAVLENESIIGVKDRINLETANTGVVASIQGDDIVFNSVEYGSSEFVYIEELTGEFRVTGGQDYAGGEISYGDDARTEINGTDYFGDGNSYTSLTIGPGTFTFDVTDEFEGDFDDITITSTAAPFTITGGNGDGTADGVDAVAVINGEQIAGTGREFTFSTGPGSFTIEFAEGFSGAFDPITIDRTNVVDVMAVTGAETTLNFSLFGDNRMSSLNISGMNTAALGGVTGSLDDLLTGGAKSGLDGNAADAVAIADEALAELDLLEAGVSTFSNTILDSAAAHNASMQATLEESIAKIQHVDEAAESALLSRNLLLAENAQGALSTFWQQRESMASMLMKLPFFA